MKITLTGYELEEALVMYFQHHFNKQVEVSIEDTQEVSAHITLGSIITDEPKAQEEPKQRRTRKKTTEPEEKEEEVAIRPYNDELKYLPERDHYAKLPKLNPEEHTKYLHILELIKTNAFNRNRDKLREAIDNASENLAIVTKANRFFKEWEEQDLKEREEEQTTEPEAVEEQETLSSIVDDITSEKPNYTQLFNPQSKVNQSGSIFNNGNQKVFK